MIKKTPNVFVLSFASSGLADLLIIIVLYANAAWRIGVVFLVDAVGKYRNNMERMYFLIRLGFECYSLTPWTGKQQNFPQDSVAGIGCGEGGGCFENVPVSSSSAFLSKNSWTFRQRKRSCRTCIYHNCPLV